MTNLVSQKKQPLLPELPIPNGAVTWLIFSLAISVGWHIQNVPIWSIIMAYVVGAYTYHRIIKEKPLPNKWLRILLTVVSVAGVLITFRSYLGRDPGITALILLSAMKLMEMKHRRDFMFIVFLCYFLVFGNFLYDQSIEDLAFTLVATILITAALLRLNHPPKEKVTFGFLMRFSLKLSLYSLPFTVLLFFLFPRTTGPLWNFSQDSITRFTSGFNDTIEPGQIAQLAQSNVSAFQVEFPNDDIPAMKDLYFRGLVLWFTNGRKWFQGLLPSQFVRPEPYTGPGILQVITLNPHNQRWLFGLDWPRVIPGWSRILPGKIFQSRRIVRGNYRYRVLSELKPEPEEFPERYRSWSMQLPRKNNQRLIALGMKWAEQADSDEEILRTARQYMRRAGFVYTLNPGYLDEDEPLEDFFFNQRRGFCEHYASAFTLLMRAAGIPARIVIGYQGGEYNPVGKYLQVRQSDAHAWTEIWLEGKGWERVDPTSWVAPERIEYGVEVSRSISDQDNMSDSERSDALENALKPGFLTKIFKFIKHNWDNINYKWDVWIISYDRYRQRDFFRELGFQSVDRLILIIAMIIIVAVFFVTVSFLLKRQTLSPDPLLRIYQQFCRKMAKVGIERLRWEGPLHFQARLLERFPEKETSVRQFNDLFVQLRYGPVKMTGAQLKQLKRLLRNI